MRSSLLLMAITGVLALSIAEVAAQQTGGAQLLSQPDLARILPDKVFLDGELAPVQKRNAAGARLGKDQVLLAMLLDTSGYSSQYATKYTGMLITQVSATVGSAVVKPGAYGVGVRKSAAGESWVLYDLGGNMVAEFAAEKNEALRPVTPLQVVAGSDGLRLYMGRFFVRIGHAVSPK